MRASGVCGSASSVVRSRCYCAKLALRTVSGRRSIGRNVRVQYCAAGTGQDSRSRSRSRKIWFSKTRKEFILIDRQDKAGKGLPPGLKDSLRFQLGKVIPIRHAFSDPLHSVPPRLALSCRVLQLLLTLIPSLTSSSSAPLYIAFKCIAYYLSLLENWS